MHRPRVRPEHLPYRIDGGRIRIGGQALGVAGEIDDPEGWIWTLLTVLDGTRILDEVVRVVADRHPDLSVEDVRAGIDSLRRAGYLEDAELPGDDPLTARDRERYARNIAYFRSLDVAVDREPWQAQVALKQAHVVVLGLGGLGGLVALALTQAGVGRLVVVDSDRVELSNLNRQVLYTEADLGRPKVEAGVARLRAVNGDVEIDAVPARVAGEDDVVDLIAGASALAMCADEPPVLSRMWANRACLRTGTPWFDGGYTGSRVTMSVFTPGVGGCFECCQALAAARDAQFTGQPDLSHAWGQARTGPVVAPSAHLAASLLSHALVARLSGVPRTPDSYTVTLDLASLDVGHELRTYPRWPSCPACRPTPRNAVVGPAPWERPESPG